MPASVTRNLDGKGSGLAMCGWDNAQNGADGILYVNIDVETPDSVGASVARFSFRTDLNQAETAGINIVKVKGVTSVPGLGAEAKLVFGSDGSGGTTAELVVLAGDAEAFVTYGSGWLGLSQMKADVIAIAREYLDLMKPAG